MNDNREHAREVCLGAAIDSFCRALQWIQAGYGLWARYELLISESWALQAQDWLKLRTDAELRQAAARIFVECTCHPEERTGGQHDHLCPAWQPECTCYEVIGGHQPGCFFSRRPRAIGAADG